MTDVLKERTIDPQTNEMAQADIARVMELLPHRYPMLMLDRVVDIVTGESATGIKNVSINEPVFVGHFPGHPVFPGVLLVEAIAQTAGALVAHTMGGFDGKVVYFMAIDKARFRKPVMPGDVVRIPVRRIRQRGPVWRFAGEARVNNVLMAEADVTAMIVDPATLGADNANNSPDRDG